MNVNSLIVSTAMADALDVIGDRWSLLVLRDVFLGVRRFEQLRQKTGASRATLTRRLESFIINDILYKCLYSTTGKRFEYRLTEKGLGLFSASLLSWQWECLWAEQGDNVLPKRLFHSSCNHELAIAAVCQHCKCPIEIGDVEWPDLSQHLDSQFQEITAKSKQRRVRSSAKSGLEDLSLVHVSSLIGDRWSLLIIIASFLGVDRYDAFQKQLNIASNILTGRLNLLVDADVLKKVAYQENPPRNEYRLTEKGKTLFPLVMVMRQWAIDWAHNDRGAEVLTHKCCKQPLVVDIQCQHCEQKPWTRDVQFQYSDA